MAAPAFDTDPDDDDDDDEQYEDALDSWESTDREGQDEVEISVLPALA